MPGFSQLGKEKLNFDGERSGLFSNMLIYLIISDNSILI